MREETLDRRARLACAYAAASASHLLLLALLALAFRSAPRLRVDVAPPEEGSKHFVWLIGADGGGGGGGRRQGLPAERLQRLGRDRASVPGPPPAVAASDASHEPNPVDRVTIPLRPLGDALTSLPGLIDAPTARTSSLGPGRGPGAGTGDGGGIGGGRGNGLDDGQQDGFGGGPFAPRGGVTMPIALHMEKPRYSTDAMRARIQGIVVIECVVRPNGRCSDIRVARSLDPIFGLDEEARRAVTEWRFKPGARLGEPVPVAVRLELEFTIR